MINRLCRKCEGSGKALTYVLDSSRPGGEMKPVYKSCPSCHGAGVTTENAPPSGEGNSYGLSVLTGLIAGGYVWVKAKDESTAIITTLIVAYIVSTRIGKIITSVIWIVLILWILAGLRLI